MRFVAIPTDIFSQLLALARDATQECCRMIQEQMRWYEEQAGRLDRRFGLNMGEGLRRLHRDGELSTGDLSDGGGHPSGGGMNFHDIVSRIEELSLRIEEFQSKPVFSARRLYLGGKLIRSCKRGSARQTAILQAFQEANWVEWIPTPLPEDQAAQTVKDLNRNLKGHLHFRASYDQIHWRRCQ